MKEIPLTQGRVSIVDDENYNEISKHRWFYGGRGYAVRNVKKDNGIYTMRRMHLIIIGETNGLEVDHINGNKLDNRRDNLRLATHAQNIYNKGSNGGSSKYKGVSWNKEKRKWVAHIKILGKYLFLGYHKIEEDAAMAYDIAATRMCGEYSRLNVII